jgi:CHAP domain
MKALISRRPAWLSVALGAAALVQGCTNGASAPTVGQLGSALSGGTVNPNDPMSNAALLGGQAITEREMQTFLTDKGSALRSYKDPDGKTAADLIVTLSEKYAVSPVYMLARIESESGLITSGSLENLDSATGCACPSTCDPSQSGFYNQVQCAASMTAGYMKELATGPTVSGWQVGVAKRSADGCLVTPATKATAALYTYTPYVGAYSTKGCGADEAGVTGLALIFNDYSSSFPGSTSSSGGSKCTPSKRADAIAKLALANVGKGACSKNSLGSRTFSAPDAQWGNSCTGDDGSPEYWCADFAMWVWSNSGVPYIDDLNALASSFLTYGNDHHTITSTPAVGDAAVFNDPVTGATEHVAIVTQVNSDGTIETVSGDWNGCPADGGNCSETAFASTSQVVHNTPAYSHKVGTTPKVMELTIAAFVEPVGVTSASCGGGPPPSEGSCTLDGHKYSANTCTETKQCDGSSWVARTSDPSSCDTGIESEGACLTDSGSVVPLNTCTSTLQCQDGVWIDRDEDPAACNCTLAGKSYSSNTCTETKQCDDGDWVARDSDPSSCLTGIESGGGCLTDSGSVAPQNTCTSTLQCQDGVWVDRDDDPSSCR